MSSHQRRAVLVLAGAAFLTCLAMLQQAHGQIKFRPRPALPVVAPVPVPVPGQPPSAEADPGEFSHAISLPKDNTLKKQIEAAIDYIKTEDWVTACDVLQKLVTIREDVFVQLPRKGPDGKERLVWTSVRAEANRLIATLPRKGLEFYKLTYNPPAQDMLKQAKASSDVSLLAMIMRAYLHTDPGGEATNLLGTYHLDRGNFVTAGLCFERLLNREGSDKLAPVTLFKAAYAFHQAGDKGNEEHVWKMLQSRVREVSIGTEKKPVAELRDYVAKLVRVNAERNINDWAFVGGKENRAGQGIGGPAFMEHRWKTPTVRTDETRGWLRQAESQMAGRQPVLSSFFPVTATVSRHEKKLPLIVFRSYWGIHAIDMKTGKLEWETPSSWSVDRMVKDSRKTAAISAWINFYLQNNNRPNLIFENSTVGSLSTDNSYVFAVDDLAVPPPAQFQNGMAFDGRFNPGYGGFGPEVQDAILHSRLQAFELATGKLKWELGGRGDKGELTDTYFLGPPLPLAGKLYSLTERQQELRLVCVDPARGRVVSTQTLATTRDKMQQDVARRTQAAHLAYGEGILVCPTNAGAILGVDLLSNSLVWAYPYREKGDAGENWNPGNGVIRGRMVRPGFIIGPDGRPYNPTMNSHWKVSAPIIQDGKVVFTAPDARSIHCLNLRDGSPLWTQRRAEDDLYLAGVFSGKALVVGKKTVRAIALNGKGDTLWTLETGQPSGQGIASDNVYYLPLKESAQNREPEICAIDMEAGRIIAHTKSRKKEVPGNLLFYEGDVLSQTPTEVVAFPQLKVQLAKIDELISKNPEDPVGLTYRGELRLDEGNLEGAIADLTKAIKNKPPAETLDKARAKLYDTLTEYFQRDFNKAEPYLGSYEELCKVDLSGATEQEKITRLAEERRRRANFLCLVAKGKESQRKLVEAFEKYQEFAAITGNQELISVVDEPTVKAAPDVWSRGRIAAMVASATADERKPLEELVGRKWLELKKKNDLNELRSFVSVFGSLFAVGRDARLLLAEKLMDDPDPKALVEAEVHLSLLRGASETREIAGRAVEALARLYLAKNLFPDAAYCYYLLRDHYKDVIIRDGKKGVDFFNEMAADKRLQPFLDPPTRLGSAGKIKVVEERSGFPYQYQIYHFDQAGEPLPFFQAHRLALRFDYHQLKLTERATGDERWSQNLTRTMFQNLVYGNGQPNMAKFTFQTLGHLIILPVGHMVFALDPVSKQILWERNLYAATNPLPGQPANPPGYNQLLVDPRDGTLQVIYPDGWTQRLGGTGPLQGGVICLQTRDALVAVDPVSNRTLWTRSDVSPRCQIFGDEQHLYIVEMGSDNHASSTRALRAYDGVTVKIPDFAATYEKRQRLVGRNILLTETDAKNAMTLRLYDVHNGKDLWKETFAPSSVALKSENPNFAGMVEPDGKVRVFDLRIRKEVLTGRMDARHLDRVQAVNLLHDGRDFFVACNGPADPNLMAFGGLQTNLMAGAGLRALPVNGAVYCFDGATSKMRWYAIVPNQMIVLEQFQDMPMVLFTSRYQKWQINGPARNVVQVVSVKSIDKRTGKLLYDNDNVPNGMNFHALNIDMRAGRIDFIGYQMKITHWLNADAATGKVGSLPPPQQQPTSVPVRQFRIQQRRVIALPAVPPVAPR